MLSFNIVSADALTQLDAEVSAGTMVLYPSNTTEINAIIWHVQGWFTSVFY